MDENDFRVITGNEPDSNVLGLVNPNTCGCTIWKYQAGHSMMLIRVEEDPFFYLAFEFVRYYEGPFSWIGASLDIGTETEKSQLLHKLGYGDFMEKFHLYKIATSNNTEIKIVALKGILQSEDIPLSFQ